MLQYKFKLPIQRRNFESTDFTFSIGHIRSRRPSVMYFILHCYDVTATKTIDEETGEFIYTGEILVDGEPVYTSERTVIGTSYGDEPSYVHSFPIPAKYTKDGKERSVIEDTIYYLIEIITLGVDSENPLYFNRLMFQEGSEYNGYHDPSEIINNHSVELPQNLYANLYDLDGNYLQVIRPNGESFNTNNLSKAKYTILAPHFEDDNGVDDHVSVFLEAMNQTEQRIDVLR